MRYCKIVQRYLHDSNQIENIALEVPSEDFDVVKALKAATAEYAKTEEGQANLKDSGGYFDLTDFDNLVPHQIMEKHGLKYAEELCGSFEFIRLREVLYVDPVYKY